jgi:tetratricopeptide (TPR) repeat protein
LNRMEDLWTGYIRELRECEALSLDERKIAIALIYQRMASEFATAASHKELRGESDYDSWAEDEYEDGEEEHEEFITLLRQQAEKHLRDALRESPQLLKAHCDLVLLYQDWDRPLEAVAAARQLLAHHPDHFDTLLWLANYFIESDMPVEAEPYVDRVSRLRPRDAAVQSLIWYQRLGVLRQLTRKRRFDEARRQLQEVQAAAPPDVKPYLMDLLQATVEYKAKDAEAAANHLQTAIGKVQEPTVIWLIMHAYADRFGLSREVKNDFRDRFKTAIVHRCETETAGHIASFLRDFVVRRVKYSGLATHQRLVLSYLNRSTKVAWKQEDLYAVCDFLRHLDSWQTQGIFSKLLPLGLRRFPEVPLFPLLQARLVMRDLPYRIDFDDVIEYFERALELNKTAELRLSEDDVENAKTGLAAAQMAREMMSSMMGRLGGFLGAEFDDEDEDWDDEDDDWDDEPRQGQSGRRWQPDHETTGSGKNQRFFPF